jgi:hypothetical protein
MAYGFKLAALLKLRETDAEERRAARGVALAQYQPVDDWLMREMTRPPRKLPKNLKAGELVHVDHDGGLKRLRRMWSPEYGDVPSIWAAMTRLQILYPKRNRG